MSSPSSKDEYWYEHRGHLFPTVSLVLKIHELVIERSGGLHGVKDEGVIDSAMHTPTQSMFGQDLYPTYFEKVTALCFSLLKSHGFNDGNKRTALEVTKAMLIKKGYEEILASDEFLMDTMRLTATGDLDKEELLLRLREACGL